VSTDSVSESILVVIMCASNNLGATAKILFML
jgi:hypothetical protein